MILITIKGHKSERKGVAKDITRMYQGNGKIVRHYVGELPNPLPMDASIIVLERKDKGE